ncbi:MAG TPA: hypothetical protein VHA73_00950 [Acidimicrobiales bacterium]|jgi:hypothetical protein|nr:hypothetical protein [Acidimicrobiales bacterium]
MEQSAAAALVSIALMGDRTDLAQILRPDPDIGQVSWSTACYEIGGLVPSAVRDFADPVEAIGALVACPEPGHVVAELIASTDTGLRWIAMTRNDRQLAFRLPDSDTASDLSGAGSANLAGALRRWRQRLEMWSAVRGGTPEPESRDAPRPDALGARSASAATASDLTGANLPVGGWAAVGARSEAAVVAPEWFRMLELRLANVEQSLVASRLAGLESVVAGLAYEVRAGAGPFDLNGARPGMTGASAAMPPGPGLVPQSPVGGASMVGQPAPMSTVGPPPEVAPPNPLLGSGVAATTAAQPAQDAPAPPADPAPQEVAAADDEREPETLAVLYVDEVGQLIDRVVADAIDHTVEHTGITIGDAQEISIEALEAELRYEMALAWEALVAQASGEVLAVSAEVVTNEAVTGEAPIDVPVAESPVAGDAGDELVDWDGDAWTEWHPDSACVAVEDVQALAPPNPFERVDGPDGFAPFGGASFPAGELGDDLATFHHGAPVASLESSRDPWPLGGPPTDGWDGRESSVSPGSSVATLVEAAPHLPDEVELMARTEVLRRAEWAVLAEEDAAEPAAEEAWMEWVTWSQAAESTGRQAAIDFTADTDAAPGTSHPGRLIALVSALVLAVGAAGFALYHYVPAIGSLG